MLRLLAFTLACTAILTFRTSSLAQDKDTGATAYKSAVRSTVWIHSDRGGGKLATGSGSLVDKEARLILTNYHVVGDVKKVTMFFPNFREGTPVPEKKYYLDRADKLGIRGQVLAIDKQADIAIIRIDSVPAGEKAIPLSTASPDVGQAVHSIGNPGGSGALWVYTAGKVRQVYSKNWKAEVDGKVLTFKAHVIETDSATNPGDSGGPLFNDKGELVGVTQGGATKAQLLSTFVDVREVKKLLNQSEVAKYRKGDVAVVIAPRAAVYASADNAKVFSAEAWKVFTAASEAEYKNGKFDFVIETVPVPPKGDAAKVKAMAGNERLAFFREIAQDRIKAKGISGIYIFVCTDPKFVFVEVTGDVAAKFPDKFRQKIQDALLASFKLNKHDDGLREIVKFVTEARQPLEKK